MEIGIPLLTLAGLYLVSKQKPNNSGAENFKARIEDLPNTNIPDYKLGIELVNKAIKKDSNFWEAHLLAAELTEKISDLEKAIFHYKKALSIDPYHSRSSKTNFFLALCEFNTGKYEDANKNMNIFRWQSK